MGINVVQKGKRAERDVASRLNAILVGLCDELGIEGVKLARNLKQTQQGGFDLDGLDWIAIEIKHQNTVNLNPWWEQCCRQATPMPGGGYMREPILIWKKTGAQWKVRMLGRLKLDEKRAVRCTVDIAWDDFAVWFTHRARMELEKALQSTLGVDVGLFD